MLSLIGKKYGSGNKGFYRDDGLIIFRNASGSKLEKIKKHMQKIFKEKMLDFIIECSIKIVNYLNVTLMAHTNLTKNQTTKRNMSKQILAIHRQS